MPRDLTHEFIEANNIVDLFLMDRLEPADKSAFEDHYLSCQDCLDALEQSATLQRGLKQAAREELEWATKRTVLSHRMRQLAIAATLTVVIAIGGFWLGSNHSVESPSASAIVNVPILRLSPLRGAGQQPSYEVGLTQAPLVLELDVGATTTLPTYRLTLSSHDQPSQILFSAEDVRPDHASTLRVVLPSRLLLPTEGSGPASRDLKVQVYGVGDNDIFVASFAFSVRRSAESATGLSDSNESS